MRRIYIHESLYDKFVKSMVTAYKSVKIGNPLEEGVLMGPLHTKNAIKEFEEGIAEIKKQGGKVLIGGGRVETMKDGNYVYPTIVEIDKSAKILNEELFLPIVYVMKF
jgi:aldehyde dehydrogenase family 7 protein A1